MKRIEKDCRGSQRIAEDHRGSQRIAEDHRGLQRIAEDCRGSSMIREDLIELKRIKKNNTGSQWNNLFHTFLIIFLSLNFM